MKARTWEQFAPTNCSAPAWRRSTHSNTAGGPNPLPRNGGVEEGRGGQRKGIDAMKLKTDTAKRPICFALDAAQIPAVVALLQTAANADRFTFQIEL
jgi:hypothetical protein